MSVKPRVAIAGKSECLTRAANVRFEVSNGGVVPRRLVIELFIDCVVCIGLFDVEVLISFWFFRRVYCCAGSCGKAERPPETHHDCADFF
jgi:hypothetical protein